MSTAAAPKRYNDYRIRMGKDAQVTLYTRYRGHNFEGWIPAENFDRAEADGVLSWDAGGNPVIDASKLPGKAVPS